MCIRDRVANHILLSYYPELGHRPEKMQRQPCLPTLEMLWEALSLALFIDDEHNTDEVKQAYDLQKQLGWTFVLMLVW